MAFVFVMLAALVIFASISVAFFGSYVLRMLLPKAHALQSLVTGEAIAALTKYMVKSYKLIIGLALVIHGRHRYLFSESIIAARYK